MNALNHHWYETSLLPQAVLKHVVPFSRIMCTGPVLYPAKNEETHGIVSYLIFPYHFTLSLKRKYLGHAQEGHMWVTSGLLSGSSESTGVTHFQPRFKHLFKQTNFPTWVK